MSDEVSDMIANFSHKGLEKLFKTGNPKGVTTAHIPRLKLILFQLNCAKSPFLVEGIQVHPLHIQPNCHFTTHDGYAVKVNANWRVVFRYDSKRKTICDVDYIDYH